MNSIERCRQREAELQFALEETKQAIMIINDRGRIRYATATAEKLLRRFCPELAAHQILPGDVGAWAAEQLKQVEQPPNCFAPAPLVIRRRRCKLVVRFCYHPPLREVLLLLEENQPRTRVDFQVLDLTEREAEILFWISEGKSDLAIAVLCGISVRTVQKHVEHIFSKLGTETRTAAVAVALTNPSQTRLERQGI